MKNCSAMWEPAINILLISDRQQGLIEFKAELKIKSK